jgi:hypothetical protein
LDDLRQQFGYLIDCEPPPLRLSHVPADGETTTTST